MSREKASRQTLALRVSTVQQGAGVLSRGGTRRRCWRCREPGAGQQLAGTALRRGQVWHCAHQDWLWGRLEEGLQQASHFPQLLAEAGHLFGERVHLGEKETETQPDGHIMLHHDAAKHHFIKELRQSWYQVPIPA